MNTKLSVLGSIYTEEVFKVILDYEIARAKRYPTPIALICIEIIPKSMDRETLQAASNLFVSALNNHIRSADIPCVNGKEIRIMLPATNRSGLISTCERILSIFKQEFETEDGHKIVFDLYLGGTAQEGGENLSQSKLLENGLSALRTTKNQGINTYFIHS
jgi:GGDEF domain-containing protein